MKIKTIKGHLTQTEKKAIKLMLESDVMAGKINRKNYFIQKDEELFRVTIKERRRVNIGGPIKMITNTHVFAVSGVPCMATS